MKLSYEDHDTITVLKLSGDLTADQIDAFRRSCQERFEADIRHVVLDLEHTTFIDSAGLEALLWIIDETSSRGGQLHPRTPARLGRPIKACPPTSDLARSYPEPAGSDRGSPHWGA